MDDIIRTQKTIDALTELEHISKRFEEMKVELGKHKITFKVEVIASTLDLVITASKANGQNYRQIFTIHDVMYMVEDASLVKTVISKMLLVLMADQYVEEFGPKIKAAMDNIKKLSTKL